MVRVNLDLRPLRQDIARVVGKWEEFLGDSEPFFPI